MMYLIKMGKYTKTEEEQAQKSQDDGEGKALCEHSAPEDGNWSGQDQSESEARHTDSCQGHTSVIASSFCLKNIQVVFSEIRINKKRQEHETQ